MNLFFAPWAIMLRAILVSAVVLSSAVPAMAQSQAIHGKWQWVGSGDYPPEVYCHLYLDTDGWERADIGELYEPNLANGTALRPLLAMHGLVRRVHDRNILLVHSPGIDLVEFVHQPNGHLILTWLPWAAGLKLRRLGHWPSEEELQMIIAEQNGAFRRRMELTPADKPFPDLN